MGLFIRYNEFKKFPSLRYPPYGQFAAVSGC
jgi:hypothetical protein